MNMFEAEDPNDKSTMEDVNLFALDITPSYFKGFHTRYPKKKVLIKGKITNDAFEWYLEVCTQEELDRLKALKFTEKQQHMLLTKIQKGVVEVVKEKEFAITTLEDPKKQLNPMGETWEVEYTQHKRECMKCERTFFISKYNGTCLVCDGIFNPTEYEELLSDITKELEKKSLEKGKKTTVFEAEGIIVNEPKKEEKTEMFDGETIVNHPIAKQQPTVIKGTIPTKGEVLVIRDPQPTQALSIRPTKEDVDWHLDMYNYVKNKVVDANDFTIIKTKKGTKKFLKKSGVRKFIPAFNLSVDILKVELYEFQDDTHCTVTVKASKPNGQYVIAEGTKSWSELFDKNIHNLRATASTRAKNRAILDLVAFGEVSAEEISEQGKQGKMFST